MQLHVAPVRVGLLLAHIHAGPAATRTRRLLRWKQHKEDAEIAGFFDLGHYCDDEDPVRVRSPRPFVPQHASLCVRQRLRTISHTLTTAPAQMIGAEATRREDRDVFRFEIAVGRSTLVRAALSCCVLAT